MFGGVLACGITHAGITPLDVTKCNMQVCPHFTFTRGEIQNHTLVGEPWKIQGIGSWFEDHRR